MKVIRKEESRERCAESGWFAWDLILDGPMDQKFILSLKPSGCIFLSFHVKEAVFQGGIGLFFSQRRSGG